MELRKTWLNKNPIILCYPEKGQHKFTVFMDSSPGIQPRLKKKRGESQMLDVDSKAKDQGGWGLAGIGLASPWLRKKSVSATGDGGQFPLLQSLSPYLCGLVPESSLFLPEPSSAFFIFCSNHRCCHHCFLSSALVMFVDRYRYVCCLLSVRAWVKTPWRHVLSLLGFKPLDSRFAVSLM